MDVQHNVKDNLTPVIDALAPAVEGIFDNLPDGDVGTETHMEVVIPH
jgi:hypothetical protein